MDLTDDSMKGTPNRCSQNVCKRDFWRIKSDRKPKASTFENNYKYGEMLVEKTSLFTHL
jgi:GTP cyclohydrolase I